MAESRGEKYYTNTGYGKLLGSERPHAFFNGRMWVVCWRTKKVCLVLYMEELFGLGGGIFEGEENLRGN